jgi:ABC-type multidrug transport system fused ATPase/permease subunit
MNSDYALLPEVDEDDPCIAYFPTTLHWYKPSDVFFLWVNPLIRTKTKLKLPAGMLSKELMGDLHRYETQQSEKNLAKALHAMIATEFWIAGWYLLMNTTLLLINTMLIKYVVQAVAKEDAQLVLSLSFLILTLSLLQALSLQQFIHGVFMCGSRVVAAVTSKIFYACLSLRIHKLYPSTSLGEIQNIQGKDAASLRDFVVFFHNMWACPLLIICTLTLLVYLLGWIPGLIGALIFPLLLPLESYLSKRAKESRREFSKLSDARMNMVQQMVDGVKTIKLTNLAVLMERKVQGIRNEELSKLWASAVIEITNSVLSQSATIIVTIVTFVAYIAINDRSISADHAFTALALINSLGRPIKVLPKIISMYAEAKVYL